MSNARYNLKLRTNERKFKRNEKKKKTKEEKKENRETLYNGQRNIQIKNFLTVFM